MFKLLNIFEIICDYFKSMKKDLHVLPFIVDLILIPLALTIIFYFIVQDFIQFANVLIITTSIFIPLLLNILIIVHYSVGRTVKDSYEDIKKMKLDFLKHINATASMVILLCIIILILSIISLNIKIGVIFKIIFLFLVFFMFVNVLITLLRTYRLINFEIHENKK